MKTNEEKIKLLEKFSAMCMFLWLASFIAWLVTFAVGSNVGMWISLGFQWLFLILNGIIKKIMKNNTKNDMII